MSIPDTGGFEIVCGMEVHVELSTRSKIFCGCSTTFGADPNTQICPVCVGLPGALPVLNQRVVEYAVRTGLALGCAITSPCRFDRKHYFYPDLPKAYQISQLHLPICRNGALEIHGEGFSKTVCIHEIHMEEDAGKLIHDSLDNATQIDYNRCGVPLLEIVSAPDMRSAAEAVAYLESLREILLFLGVSDCKMQEGSMRADINLSVRPVGQVTLGTRTEIKNMNSFRAIRQAIDGEAARQIALLAAGGTVIQETRRWDDEKGISISMRAKESVRDYRYFPDPDLQDVFIDEEWIQEVYRSLPELPAAKRERYRLEYGLSPYDAEMLTGAREIADLFEQAVKSYSRPKEIANQIITEVGRLLTETATPPEQINLDPVKLAQVARMVVDGRINRTTGREVLELVFREDVDPIRYVEEKDLAMVDDRALIGQAVSQVLLTHEKSVADYKSGKEKAFRFLVGQVMRELKGRADPALVNQVLRDQLQQKCE